MRRGRIDTPNWAIEVGQNAQRLPGNVARGLAFIITGSSHPAYTQVRWHTAAEVISSETLGPAELPQAEADPDASLVTAVLPRLKRKAVVVEAGQRLPEIRNAVTAVARVAIAYTYKDKTHVGDLPGEIRSLFTADPKSYRAALRTGRNEFGAGLGVWLPDEQTFILPPDSKIKENNIPIKDLAAKYPGIRLF